MTDSYRGETLSKKIARAWFWLVAREFLGERFYDGNHLVLASREGGDAFTLKAMGVKPSRIIACELSRSAARAFVLKHPDVAVHVGEVSSLVTKKQLRASFVCAHLDFCSWFTSSVADYAVRVARFGIADEGLLSIGVMKGRESGVFAEAIAEEREGLRMIPYGSGDRLSWSNRVVTSMSRSRLIDRYVANVLDSSGPVALSRSLCVIGYDSGRTPMLFSLQAVHRHISRKAVRKKVASIYRECSDIYLNRAIELGLREKNGASTNPMSRYRSSEDFCLNHPFVPVAGHSQQFGAFEFGEADPAIAVVMAGVCEGYGFSGADMLNIRPQRLAAWRAHVTRGTYDRAG